MTTTIFPSRYIQRYNALLDLGVEVKRLANKAFFVLDPFAFDNLLPDCKDKIEESVHTYFERFSGECCDEEIDRLCDVAKHNHCHAIVGIGGGKALDTAKAVAYKLNLPVVIVPTIASTDAPCSALSVIYNEDGSFNRYLVLPANPNLVLVDTKVIVNAPVRFLVAGIGDALATWFEAESCKIGRKGNMTGDVGSMTAYSLANLCYETLLEYGVLAKTSCEAKAVTPAFDKVVEANILLSGLGFESGGLASCHAIHNGLTCLEGTHKFWHGEKVAFGVVSSMFLAEKDSQLVDEVFEFCLSVGLPVTLEDIGLKDVNDDDLWKVAELTCSEGETVYNENTEVTPQKVFDAMKAADAYGRELKYS